MERRLRELYKYLVGPAWLAIDFQAELPYDTVRWEYDKEVNRILDRLEHDPASLEVAERMPWKVAKKAYAKAVKKVIL